MKTKAAILYEFNKLEIEDIDLPSLQHGQVLVDIHYTSICGSQINEYLGKRGPDKYLPHLMGHEAVGVVLETHKSIIKVKPGDSVVCTWLKTSGLHGGPVKYGNVNSGPIATFTEKAIISEDKLILSPTKLLPEHSLMGCAIPTSLGAVWEELESSSNILIVGAGSVGLGIILSCGLSQDDIYFIDILFNNIAKARRYATEYKDNESPLVDIIFECTGSINSIQQSMKRLTSKGKLVIIGNPPQGLDISIDPYDLILGKEICGYHSNKFPYIDYNIEHLLEQENFIDKYRILIGKQFDLESINNAFSSMQMGTGKAIIRCQP